MRVEIVDGTIDPTATRNFPPGGNHVDLRQHPRGIEQIAPARQHSPFRNFLTAVNGAESVLASVAAAVESHPLAGASNPETYEFGSRTSVIFAAPAMNFNRDHFTELAAGLKELLERDPGDTIRGVLHIPSCHFTEQDRPGFCLEIQLVGRGDSAQQAELRWGLGLARVQQALLFRARALGQKIGA